MTVPSFVIGDAVDALTSKIGHRLRKGMGNRAARNGIGDGVS
jgi:hypothetical protein